MDVNTAMVSPRWKKVLADLWISKTRTVLVVLSITVGVFSVGLIAGTSTNLSEELTRQYLKTNPASAIIWPDGFDDELVDSIRRVPGVKGAEGRRSGTVRLQTGPETWRDLRIYAFPDYEDIQVDIVRPEFGGWPPEKREILLERSSLEMASTSVGQTVLVRTPQGRQRELQVVGTAHDLNQFPSPLAGITYGYVTLDTLEWLGWSRRYSELHIVVDGNALDIHHIRRVTENVKRKIEKSGRRVYSTWIPTPGEHPANDIMQPMLVILGVLGFLSLIMSGFLVANTISALLTQQVRQIGIMKAVGARRSQIAALYLVMVTILGGLSLLIGIPASALGARLLTGFLAKLINFDLERFRIPLSVIILQVCVGLLVPFFASVFPIRSGTMVTVRKALGSYGLAKGQFGSGLVDRVVEKVRFASRPMLVSIRNTVRRKGRLLLTLITLTLGGAVFVGILSVYASMLRTLDQALDYWKYDAALYFTQEHRVTQLEREALAVPGVLQAESWGFRSARRVRDDHSESQHLDMIAVPVDTQLLKPELLAGRWLVDGDESAIVVNTEVLKDDPDIAVGDNITLKVNDRETDWKVVGIVKGVLTGRILYVNYPYFSQVMRDVGKASSVHVVTEQHDDEYISRVTKRLEQHLESVGMRVSRIESMAQVRKQIEFQFNILVAFMLIMAVLLGIVGGLGLAGTMSINVLERTREIGVMRAIGASNRAVFAIFAAEGVLIGLISWALGSLLALPLGLALSNVVGVAFTRAPLVYTFSVSGVLLWLLIVVLLALAASLMPARRAAQITVRDALSYE